MPMDITLAGGAGEYMESATLVAWAAEPGAPVKRGEIVALVETAKATTEIEAPCDGVLLDYLADVGAEIAKGQVLGRVAEASDAADALSGAPEPDFKSAPVPAVSGNTVPVETRVKASPLARRLAAEHGLDLSAVEGTGPGRRIKSRDIAGALRQVAPLRPWSHAAALNATTVPRPEPVGEYIGQATPMILIHGFGASAAGWNLLLPRLHGTPVLALDLPAHGRQRRVATGFDDLVRSVLDDLHEAAIDAVHLVGHSLGGAIAARVAASAAVHVRSLTLLSPAGLGPGINGSFLDGFSVSDEPPSLHAWLSCLVADPAVLPPGFADLVLRDRQRFGLGPAQAALARVLFPSGTQTFDIRADLARVACPTRVIWGKRDAIISVRHARDLPGAVALHRLDGVGHLPHLEAPDLVARLLLETRRSSGP